MSYGRKIARHQEVSYTGELPFPPILSTKVDCLWRKQLRRTKVSQKYASHPSSTLQLGVQTVFTLSTAAHSTAQTVQIPLGVQGAATSATQPVQLQKEDSVSAYIRYMEGSSVLLMAHTSIGQGSTDSTSQPLNTSRRRTTVHRPLFRPQIHVKYHARERVPLFWCRRSPTLHPSNEKRP